MKRLHKYRNSFWILLLAGVIHFLFIHKDAEATKLEVIKEVDFAPKHNLELVIGQNEPNRIQLNKAEVLDIVGDEAKYGLYWSSDRCHFFIVPKAAVGEIISISLILAGGLAQDIRFTVGDIPAQTVLINMDSKKKNVILNEANPLADRILRDEITSMMRAMMADNKGKYYVATSDRNLSLQVPDKNLWVFEEKVYRYKDLAGVVLKVRGKNKGLTEVKASDFSNIFSKVLAVSVENPLLARNQKGRVFVVTRALEE